MKIPLPAALKRHHSYNILWIAGSQQGSRPSMCVPLSTALMNLSMGCRSSHVTTTLLLVLPVDWQHHLMLQVSLMLTSIAVVSCVISDPDSRRYIVPIDKFFNIKHCEHQQNHKVFLQNTSCWTKESVTHQCLLSGLTRFSLIPTNP